LFSDNDQIGFSVVVIREWGARGSILGGGGSGRVCRTTRKKETSNNGAEHGVNLKRNYPIKLKLVFVLIFF